MGCAALDTANDDGLVTPDLWDTALAELMMIMSLESGKLLMEMLLAQLMILGEEYHSGIEFTL